MSTPVETRSLGLIHTVSGLVPVFADLVRTYLPDWQTFNIVDETLLKNTIRAGKLETPTMRRLAGHVWTAEDSGADAVLVTCSSIGPAVDATRPMCSIPLVRVDAGMVEEALDSGCRIGVLATLSTTLVPTVDLVTTRASQRGAHVRIESHLCEGAFEALSAGDRDDHNARIREGLSVLAGSVDVIILAQASMANALDDATRASMGLPVLASPELSVRHLAKVLETSLQAPPPNSAFKPGLTVEKS